MNHAIEHDYATSRGAAGSIEVVARRDLARCPRWTSAFSGERKDHRYYEIVEDTLQEGFEYSYFAIKDEYGVVRSVQPFFVLDQDLLAGTPLAIKRVADAIRRVRPRFMRMRTLMIGCVAGEGHLDDSDGWLPDHLAFVPAAIVKCARDLNVQLVVLKEFPAKYRAALRSFVEGGFTRVPSLPMTKLNIEFGSFDEYFRHALNSATRTKLRRKFRASAQAAPIEMSIVHDVASEIDRIYALYLQVYERSKLHFEKLTKEYFCGLGRAMPDKVRFFVWRQNGKIVAFTQCMIHDDAIFAEYIGLDYSVALDLHLYHCAVRDMIGWSIAHGYRWFRSSGLNYDPKLHLRHVLDPVDLYVRHVSVIPNMILKRVLPLIEPVRYEATLKKFANYRELWGDV